MAVRVSGGGPAVADGSEPREPATAWACTPGGTNRLVPRTDRYWRPLASTCSATVAIGTRSSIAFFCRNRNASDSLMP